MDQDIQNQEVPKDEFISVFDAAHELRYTPHGIRRAIVQKRLVAVQVGKIWVIRRVDFDAYKQSVFDRRALWRRKRYIKKKQKENREIKII